MSRKLHLEWNYLSVIILDGNFSVGNVYWDKDQKQGYVGNMVRSEQDLGFTFYLLLGISVW